MILIVINFFFYSKKTKLNKKRSIKKGKFHLFLVINNSNMINLRFNKLFHNYYLKKYPLEVNIFQIKLISMIQKVQISLIFITIINFLKLIYY